jgi:polysaccharide chain length determinant protein (PEP-CTERM system associated)
MQELLAQLFTYLWGVWRFRWMALLVAWSISVGGWIAVSQLPDAYSASARIYVDSNTVLGPLLKGLTIQPNIEQRISLMSKTLLSRPNLEKLMRMADLDLQVRSDLETEMFMTKLRESISLSGERGNASLYSIRYVNEDRDTAKRIVQALITVFIESSLGDKREDSTDAQSFLDQQIADYEVRLVDAENRLADFKQRYVGTLPGETGGYYQRLAEAQNQQQAAMLQLKSLENRRDELKSQLSGDEPVFLSSGVDEFRTSFSPLDQRIQSLQAARDSLLTRYTERYPEVIQITRLLEQLEAEREQEAGLSVVESSGGAMALTSSPAYQDMRTMLGETEANIAGLTVVVEEYTRRVAELKSKVDNIPNIETELLQLDRDYQVVVKQHQELLARRESAMISQRVEQNANDVTFRVVDPPFVPLKPSEPNKLLLHAGVLVVSLGVGVALALLLSLLRPVFVDPRSLAIATGMPLLGIVTNFRTPKERRTAFIGKIVFSFLSLCLILVFAGVSAIQGGLIAV